jgi:hypothetical protein
MTPSSRSLKKTAAISPFSGRHHARHQAVIAAIAPPRHHPIPLHARAASYSSGPRSDGLRYASPRRSAAPETPEPSPQ